MLSLSPSALSFFENRAPFTEKGAAALSLSEAGERRRNDAVGEMKWNGRTEATMAQQSKTTSNAAASTITNLQEEQAKAATFHDFLGMKPADSSPARFPSKLSDPRFGDTSPSASVSAGRGPFSSASDLGSGTVPFP